MEQILFKSILLRAGLSQKAASTYLRVSLDTIKKWSSGVNPIPWNAEYQIIDLMTRQRALAHAHYNTWLEKRKPPIVLIRVPINDEVANHIDWPSARAYSICANILYENNTFDMAIRIERTGNYRQKLISFYDCDGL